MKTGRHSLYRLLLTSLTVLLSVIVSSACSGSNGGNEPYEPDTPAPAAHEGLFVSEHGSLAFNGDGGSIVIDFDAYLAGLTGLPEGRREGTYVFLSGDLPPHGSIPVRYDIAHEMQISVGGQSAVMEMGIASEDGSAGLAGVNTVTPERIPMLFSEDGHFFTLPFEKQANE